MNDYALINDASLLMGVNSDDALVMLPLLTSGP
jgi:hypothetical protein